jgi:hypothetical protein
MLSPRFISFLFLILFSALILTCANNSPLEPDAGEVSAISASMQMPHKGLLAAELTKIHLTVSGSGMTSIEKDLTLTGSSASGKIEVPVDKKLTLAALAYKDTVKVLQGSVAFTAKKGAANAVQIPMDFAVAAIILTPPDSSYSVSDTVSIHLEARHVTDLSALGARVSFDTAFVEILDFTREDNFLSSNAGAVVPLTFSKDDTKGTLDVILGIFPATGAVSSENAANTKIAHISLKAKKQGSTRITISLDNQVDSDLGLFDKNAILLYSLSLGSEVHIQ